MASPMSVDRCGEELAGMLGSQAEVCRGILALSERQQKMVEDRREDELLSLLNDKQRLIDRHQELFRKSLPLREQWEGEGSAAAPAVHARVEAAWNELRGILDNIVRLEDASRAVLQDHKGEVSMDIGQLQKGKIVNKAYGGGTRLPPRARFGDRRG